ncbi:2,3-dimethylmalate lyase [Lasiodiplodia hormozganensis]|uniref:2,3-dimethylmalate lyase n=1 Tax=Lasiodiplodia hormozganensis TaxID=869390 RepID=A0AA39Y846_9PEZI|nr:2,3-dimethylmalate lyase [Lasiodiplodia hormozganensis]
MTPHSAEPLTSAFIVSEKSIGEPIVTELSADRTDFFNLEHDSPSRHSNNVKNGINGLAPLTEVQEHVNAPPPPRPTLSPTRPPAASTKLRKMLEETDDLIVCPGVYDGISARAAHEVGFNAMYMTGAGTTASRLGQPDLGIAHLHDMRANAEMIANLDPYGPPLIADMDTGYGGPIIVARTISEYIRAGVAGAHLEDQVLTKRCGHLGGKKVVPRSEYVSRLRAAHAARAALHSDFVLIARTDALQTLGYDECVARLREAREIGFDVGLLEGFTSKEQARRCVADLAPWPVLLNMVENGVTPLITVDEAREMGFRIMIFSFATVCPAYLAIKETLERLRDKGVVGTPKDMSPRALFEVCGLKECMQIDLSAGSQAFAEGV